MLSIQNNNHQNKKQVLILEEIQKRKIVEHNDLISSVAKMDKTPLKIFELAVSCIDTEKPPKDNIIYLSKKELFTFFDVTDSNKHSRFKKAIIEMQKQAFFEIKETNDSAKGYKMKSIVPIPFVEWNSYNDEVILQFQPQIMPYLIDLKQNFTQYALSDVMELNSKYSIILYKWLCMYYNQYEHYGAKGGRQNKQLEEYRNPSISILELRYLTNTLDEYKHISNFFKRILDEPIEEINARTHFIVTYEKIKKGRSIVAIQFHITKKQVAPHSLYKEEQQDPIYIQEKEKKEEQQTMLFAKAMQSQYTTILMENMLIGYKDMQHIETMTGLQTVVYPLYDELVELKGLQEVKKHISYVSSKQEGYSKRNIVKYLKEAIKGYLVKVKTQRI
ncbi:MAG: RepB family plasmid replication initiator protein [Enterococcus sp.]|nr:RepB family plasmid replication initiator protein [Enterococcus sp.]